MTNKLMESNWTRLLRSKFLPLSRLSFSRILKPASSDFKIRAKKSGWEEPILGAAWSVGMAATCLDCAHVLILTTCCTIDPFQHAASHVWNITMVLSFSTHLPCVLRVSCAEQQLSMVQVAKTWQEAKDLGTALKIEMRWSFPKLVPVHRPEVLMRVTSNMTVTEARQLLCICDGRNMSKRPGYLQEILWLYMKKMNYILNVSDNGNLF